MASPAPRPARAFPDHASQAILRALPAHVALVDAEGRVVEVNEAWRRFARENGWSDAGAGIGTSYLEVCDAAARHGDEDGRAVGAGLRAVLAGRERGFDHEYACHGPGARRWYQLAATAADEGGAVVMHVDITERRLFEDALRENAALLRSAQRMAGLGNFHIDLSTGRLTLAEETCTMLGCGAVCCGTWGEFIARVHREEQSRLAAEMEALIESRGTLDTQVRFFRADGAERWLRIRAESMSPASARRRIAGTIMDITERRAAGEAIRASEERLRRLSEHLRDMLENMPDGFFTLDREWRVAYLNRAAERLAGGPREHFIGRVLWELFPEEQPTYRPQYERALREQHAVEFEAWSPQLGIWTEVRAYPTRGGLGVYIRDVTERRRIQDELRASEERFARVAQVTADAIWDWDVASGVVWRSDGMERLFGREVAEQTSRQSEWIDRLHPEERPAVLEEIRRTLRSGATQWSRDYRFRRADGTYAWVQDRAFIIRDEKGWATRVVGGMSDVTGQYRARELLQEQARLLDHARDAIHVRDLEHRVQYLNRSAEALYGWSSEEAVGRSIQALLHRDPEAFRRAFHHLLEHGEWTGEMEKVTRDGRQLVIEARWTLMRDAQGVPRRILAIDTDVTERRMLEQQLIRSQRLDSIGTLAGGIAHDLNNVFTPILMAANLLDGPGRPAEEAALVEAIRTSARRGVDMIGQLLSFARGADGARVAVRPEDIVSGVLTMVAETFPKDIVVETRVAPRLPAVLGDATQLHQVLLNLCVNARDAMPRGGRLRIDAHLMPEPLAPGAVRCVAFEVGDTGTGITAEHLEKLWDPFFTTKAPGLGTGLGLPTSLAIVKGHGGQIRVRSHPGRGSIFTVLIPAHEDEAPAQPVADAAPAPRGEGRRVLVVDDEEPVRSMARRALEGHGYAVSEAADGAEAVRVFRAAGGGIDVVLLDLMMPVMDGPEAIGALRAIDPHVRIVATTGYASPERMAKVAEAGVACLPKPYAPDELLRAVAAGIEPPRAG